jgi:mRNA interferase MazF
MRQGEIYWVDLPDPIGSGPGFRRPCVVIQNDIFNRSRISTTIVLPLTSNMKLADSPGNVALEPGEGGTSRPSVVNVSQIVAVDRTLIGQRIGQLSGARIREILDGLRLMTEPREL